jgi:hypothetical protein
MSSDAVPGRPCASQVLGLALRHGSPSLAQDVAAAVVPALTLTAGKLAAELEGCNVAEGVQAEAAGASERVLLLQRAGDAAGALRSALRLVGTEPCDALLAASPSASTDLGMACVCLALATSLPGLQQLLGLAAEAALVAGRCLGHAHAAAEGGRLSWAGLFQLARSAAGALQRTAGLQPPSEQAPLMEVWRTTLDALTAHGQQVGSWPVGPSYNAANKHKRPRQPNKPCGTSRVGMGRPAGPPHLNTDPPKCVHVWLIRYAPNSTQVTPTPLMPAQLREYEWILWNLAIARQAHGPTQPHRQWPRPRTRSVRPEPCMGWAHTHTNIHTHTLLPVQAAREVGAAAAAQKNERFTSGPFTTVCTLVAYGLPTSSYMFNTKKRVWHVYGSPCDFYLEDLHYAIN